MWTCVVVFALLTGGAHSLGDMEHHSCEKNQVMSGIESSLGPDGERQWKIECKALEIKDCSWSGFQDTRQRGLRFSCPANQTVAGFVTEVVQGVRRWNIYCCSAPGLITSDCQKTPMVNWNEDLDWHVPADSFLTGIYARTNKADDVDQRWSFRHCTGTTGDSESVFSKIFAINKAINKQLIQGDIVVNNNRNAMTCDSCKWKKTKKGVKVPYTLARQFSRSEKRAISQAMKTFKTSTCIRFIRRKRQRDYIEIVKDSGCWSYVGRIGGSQQLSLGNGCVYTGIIQHELSHALGFWHEQSRSDRDSYVTINYQNIIEYYASNFDKMDTNNLNVPYDYGSVMHYGAKDFSKNGEDTITPLTPSVEIGQRVGMSEDDILKINKLYGCEKHLSRSRDWNNELHNTMNRTCPSGQVVSSIRSVYSQSKKDRLWDISCVDFKPVQECSWSSYVNGFRSEIDFKCADDKVIAGVMSRYSRSTMDRRWKFYCCSFSDFTTINPTKTAEVNTWTEFFMWSVPSSSFLTGVKGVFDAGQKDRRWTFTYSQQQA